MPRWGQQGGRLWCEAFFLLRQQNQSREPERRSLSVGIQAPTAPPQPNTAPPGGRRQELWEEGGATPSPLW